jgi:hypothetical protein
MCSLLSATGEELHQVPSPPGLTVEVHQLNAVIAELQNSVPRSWHASCAV